MQTRRAKTGAVKRGITEMKKTALEWIKQHLHHRLLHIKTLNKNNDYISFSFISKRSLWRGIMEK